MVAFQFPINGIQWKRIYDWVENKVGKPYGFCEFLEELFPDPSTEASIKNQSYICSSLWACAYALLKQNNFSLVLPGIDPRMATPGDIFNGCEPNLNVQMFRYNW